MKEEKLQQTAQKQKEITKNSHAQKIRQLEEKDKKNVKFSNTESGRNRKSDQINH